MCSDLPAMTDRPLVAIPVKSLELAKSRLSATITHDMRRGLGSGLATRTAWTARDAGADVIVVAGAEEVREWAQRVGFAAVAQPPDHPGLNGAATFGCELALYAAREPYVLHAVLPLHTPAVLRRAFRTPGAVIAPSHDGGTTFMGPVPPEFRFAYGVGSYSRHIAMLPAATPLVSPELALDIDSSVDLSRALDTRRGRWLTSLVGPPGVQ